MTFKYKGRKVANPETYKWGTTKATVEYTTERRLCSLTITMPQRLYRGDGDGVAVQLENSAFKCKWFKNPVKRRQALTKIRKKKSIIPLLPGTC